MIDIKQRDKSLKNLGYKTKEDLLRQAEWKGFKDALTLGEPLNFNNIFSRMRQTVAEEERKRNEMNNQTYTLAKLEGNQYEL